ncbi:MAG: GNAT family N-acetyltransferase [Dorea sp.]|nr:GNAT family N-acetyltransferase [Dorea sp.]
MESFIRKARPEDMGRVAEIIVFNNRLNYYPIFQNMEYSFGEYNVFDVAKDFLSDPDFMDGCYVYEDRVIRGVICVVRGEIKKLYVDYFFQGEGIGSKLLTYAIEKLQANHVWALEKNYNALKFYRKFGFEFYGEKELEEDTTEYLWHLYRKV